MRFKLLKDIDQVNLKLKKPTIPLLLLLAVIAIGIIGYDIIWTEYDSTFMDEFNMTFITISTVGYNEIHPLDTTGRIFTVIVGVAGIGSLFYVLSVVMENLFIIQIYNLRSRKKVMKQISKLSDHIILVGHGRVGRLTAIELASQGEKFVVIDENYEEEPDPILVDKAFTIEGDATQDAVLLKAGITRARGMIVATGNSATTVFVVLSAKVLNPALFIIARADSENAIEKLKKAGANQVVNPYSIGGVHLAHKILNPYVIEFVESSLQSSKNSLNIENVIIAHTSNWIGQSLKDLDIRKKTGATIIAVVRDKEPISNPGASFILKAEDQLVSMGTKEQLKSLGDFAIANL